MTTTVDAIYQGGVFRPAGPVDLPENQRVHLRDEPVRAEDMRGWLSAVEQWQREFVARRGYLPDSTYLIAEDRMRGV
jgi:predicted DNA-binding antitoxin AbrB/MazE fold protein